MGKTTGSGIGFKVLESGNLQVEVRGNGSIVVLQVEPQEAAAIAVGALDQARVAHEKSGHPLASKVGGYEVLVPSTVGLGPSKIPGHECIVVRSGRAAMGVSIPREICRDLGESLIALSAGGGVQQ